MIVAAPGSFLSHVAAAVMWRLPLPLRVLRAIVRPHRRDGRERPPAGIDVSVLSPRRSSKAHGVNGHELAPHMVAIRSQDGVRVASPASVWAMLATVLSVDELVRLGDAIVYIPRRKGMERGTPADALATIDQLRMAAAAGRREGVQKLRAALALIRVGAASPGETDTRLLCVRAGLPEPVLDFDVIARSGRAIGFTEFAYVEWRILMEYEGDHHRTDRDQWNRDIDKHAACVAAGWEVLRLTSRHVYPDGAVAIGRIRDALLRAGWQPDTRR